MALVTAGCSSAAPDQPTTAIKPAPRAETTTPPPPAPDSTTTEAPPTQGPDQIEYPAGIVPTRLEIPSIGVDATILELDLRGDEPQVPANFDDTGWYQQTRLPGEIGPSVIAGHIDSVNGPAVFVNLDKLVPGDQIAVSNRDGETRTFVVTHTGQYPKTDLPTEVFGFDKPLPELRLITCGGTFNPTSGHYRDNYVVYAELKT